MGYFPGRRSRLLNLVLTVSCDVFRIDVSGPPNGVGHHELSHEPGVALTDATCSQYRLVVGVPRAQGSHNQGIYLDLVALGSQGVSQWGVLQRLPCSGLVEGQ